MEVRTKRQLINTVAERWKETCYRSRKWVTEFSEVVYDKLVALPDNASEEQIADIIGNREWTKNECSECETDSSITVMLGEIPSYESQTAFVCLDCLQKALILALALVVSEGEEK